MRTNAYDAPQGAGGDARPSPSLPQALLEAGIHLKSQDHGQHRAACPECARSTTRRGDIALTVRLDGTGATWLCFRCNWTGGLWTCRDCGGASPSRTCPCEQTRDEQATAPRPPRRADPPPLPPRAGLSDEARRLWDACRPITPGSPAAVYLEGRGCALPENDVR